jgi:hypothetical protein
MICCCVFILMILWFFFLKNKNCDKRNKSRDSYSQSGFWKYSRDTTRLTFLHARIKCTLLAFLDRERIFFFVSDDTIRNIQISRSGKCVNQGIRPLKFTPWSVYYYYFFLKKMTTNPQRQHK